MSDHEIGTMDITEQKKTYQGFIDVTVKSIYIVIFILLFLAVFVA